MSKTRKSIVGKFGNTLGNSRLPSPEQTTKTVHDLTRQSTEDTEERENPKSYRKKFTCMMDPALSSRLKIQAIEEGKSASDLLEEILHRYFENE